MKNGNSKPSKSLAIAIPGLFLVWLFVTPILKGEVFQRIAVNDAQWFYGGHVQCDYYFHYFNGQPMTTNINFVPDVSGDTFYVDYLDTMGINYCFTGIIHPLNPTGDMKDFLQDSHIYGNILVGNGNNHNVIHYGFAHDYPCGVGDDLDHDEFTWVHDPGAGRIDQDPLPQFQNWVILSERDEHNAGYLIDTTFDWTTFNYRVGPRLYHVQLCIRVDTTGKESNNPLIMRVGLQSVSDQQGSEHTYYYHPPAYSWYAEDFVDETDDLPAYFDLRVNDLDSIGLYYYVVDFADSFSVGGNNDRPRFTVYWADSVDLYLDWIRFFDQEFYDMAIDPNPDVISAIKSDALEYWCEDYMHSQRGWEPFRRQWPAVRFVDSLCSDTSRQVLQDSIRYLCDINPMKYPDIVDYLNSLRTQPNIVYCTYPLTSSIDSNSVSAGPGFGHNLQWAWDWNMIENGYWRGLNAIARVADSLDIPFMNYIQCHEEWKGSIATFTPFWRDPTYNEIICQAYLTLTFGAKGIGYYMISPYYRRENQTYGYTVIRYNDNVPGGWETRGIFDLKTDSSTFPTEQDFPDIFSEGHFEPNYKYHAIVEFENELDLIDSLLMILDWDTSFCTKWKDVVTTQYDYIDSVWTSQDQLVDTTFVQVGVFSGSAGVYDINKYLMFVNRRCLASESRAVNYRLDFESEYRNQCFCVIDYVLDPNLVRLVTTDDDGILIDSIISLPPGHGRLLNIHNLYPSKMTIDTNAVVDWLPDTLIFVSDTVDVYGTLTFILVLM
jgi:hypothetical protein